LNDLLQSGFDHVWVGEPAGLLNLWRPARHLPVGLMISPFAEEQSRCRRLQYDVSDAMAKQGVHICWLDLPGTGDSPLAETEISAAFWLACVHDALTWHAQSGQAVQILGGLRLGGAVAHHAALPMTPAPKLVVLEPISGSYALRALLRSRAAQGDKSADELTRMIAAGATIEAAGYPLNAASKATLDHFTLPDSPAANQTIIRARLPDMPPWLQVEPTPAPKLTADLSQQLTEAMPR
jgi:alpha-beta hydrolase superfamily lysophospholipase